MPLTEHEIESRFGHHKATIEGPEATLPKHTDFRTKVKEFVRYLDDVCPDGRYKSLALTELEISAMLAHKAIAESAPLIRD
jgi:hypothetical protein